MEDTALVFEGEVVPDLLKVGLDLSWFAFLIALGALFEQGVNSRLAGFDRTQVDIGIRTAQGFGKSLVKGGVPLGFGGGELGVKVRPIFCGV